jgi:hypothetical protein
MANPLPCPPIVYGPIYTTSTQVQVDNLLPDSTVIVYSGTKPVGTANTPNTTASPGCIWVPLTKTPSMGDQVTATQQYNGSDPKFQVLAGQPSKPSTSPVPVLLPPATLPAPTFASGLCTCMDWVYMDQLIPGATLTITLGKTPMVNATVTQTPQWFELAVAPIPEGSVLEATQSGLGSKTSSPTPSNPIPVAPPLGAPVIKPEPEACQTILSFSDMQPGADLNIINGSNQWLDQTSINSSWNMLGLAPPLQALSSPLSSSAQQYFTRCKDPQGGNLMGPLAHFTVLPPNPKLPTVKYPLCQDATQLVVGDVVSGEILTLAVSYSTTGGKQPPIPLGACQVSGRGPAPSPVPLPPGWYPTAPDVVAGSVTLQITGLLCDVASPVASVPVTAPPASGPVAVQAPLNDCATSVFVKGAQPGSLIQVFSGLAIPGTPLSNPHVATTAEFPIPLWGRLTPADQVFVTQQGCGSNKNSLPAVPVSAPPKLSAPTVAGNYVLSTATSVLVNKVVPGAQVTLFVNGSARGSAVDSILAEVAPPKGTPPLIEVSLPVGWPPLKPNHDVLTAGQELCGVTALPSAGGGGVTVQAPVPAPSGGPGEPKAGLGSNANYYMFQPTGSGCANLLNVSVTLVVTEDIVWQSTGPAPPGCPPAPPTGTPGLSLQLNCYSPAPKSPNPGYPNWQQYIINLFGTQLLGAINTWNTFSSLVIFPSGEYTTPLGPPLPGPNPTLPKGYTLTITLSNDASGNVVGVTWVVNGKSYAPSPPTIPALLTANGLPATDVAPIVAFTVNLVGPISAESAVLSSGAGIITYSAKSPLTVTNAEPAQCVEALTGFTCERATTSYGFLPANPGNPFSQTFAASAATPLIRRLRGRPLVRR